MESKEIIVSDDSILISLKSKDEEELLESAQLIIEFLVWRKNHKKILTIPSNYQQLYGTLKKGEIKKEEELKAYFENFFEEAKFIGTSEKNPPELEYNSLLENLWTRGIPAFFISNNPELHKKITGSNVVIMTLKEFKSVLFNKREFYDFIYDKYYDSSA